MFSDVGQMRPAPSLVADQIEFGQFPDSAEDGMPAPTCSEKPVGARWTAPELPTDEISGQQSPSAQIVQDAFVHAAAEGGDVDGNRAGPSCRWLPQIPHGRG